MSDRSKASFCGSNRNIASIAMVWFAERIGINAWALATAPERSRVRELNVALTAHHVLKTGVAQSSQQIVLLGIDSEGPENLEGRASAINSEQANFLGAEEVGHDLAQASIASS